MAGAASPSTCTWLSRRTRPTCACKARATSLSSTTCRLLGAATSRSACDEVAFQLLFLSQAREAAGSESLHHSFSEGGTGPQLADPEWRGIWTEAFQEGMQEAHAFTCWHALAPTPAVPPPPPAEQVNGAFEMLRPTIKDVLYQVEVNTFKVSKVGVARSRGKAGVMASNEQCQQLCREWFESRKGSPIPVQLRHSATAPGVSQLHTTDLSM
eukprot:1158939-Pelagomonas_calceolata.AAC.1